MKYTILHVEGGIGKNIVATNVVRCIKKQYPDRHLVVTSTYPEVFIHNPYVYRVYKVGMCSYFYDDYIKDKDTIVFRHEPYFSNGVITRQKSLAESWCESLDVMFDYNKPELYFNIVEQQNASILLNKYNNGKEIIAVQINGGPGGSVNNHINFNWFRDLPPRYVLPIIEKHKDKYTFAQIRNRNQLLLDNAVDVDLSLRELLIFLSQVKGAICIDSMVQHTMAVFNKPSIVAWIGNSPTVYGYDFHKNITSNITNWPENLESYMEPYPLITQGHQCPSNYNPATVFSERVFSASFESLFHAGWDNAYTP